MAEVIGVRFKAVGKVYYFDPKGIQTRVDQQVIVETTRGIECGWVVIPNRQVENSQVVKPLKKLVRVATAEDIKRVEENREKERRAFKTCQEKIRANHLEMKLVEVEYAFDGSKILFYFTAEERVDFRELVKDLAAIFRTRIELRQIGVRDEAKMLGGLGICGNPFCCATFLGEFQPVSIKMAKEQGLSLNPAKISGTCGRLMCCLKYEQAAYEDLIRTTPKAGALVETPEGRGVVVEVGLLVGLLKVRLEQSADGAVSIFDKKDVKVLGAGKKQGEPKAPAMGQDKLAEKPVGQSLPQKVSKEGENPGTGEKRRKRRRPKSKKTKETLGAGSSAE